MNSVSIGTLMILFGRPCSPAWGAIEGGLVIATSPLAENPQLAGWAHLQRSQNRKGALSAVRKARLDALGFEWSRKS